MEARPISVNKKNSCSKLLKPVIFHGRLPYQAVLVDLPWPSCFYNVQIVTAWRRPSLYNADDSLAENCGPSAGQPAHKRVLPGAWHTLLGDVNVVFPQHQGQCYHKQVEKSWLSGLGEGLTGAPRRSRMILPCHCTQCDGGKSIKEQLWDNDGQFRSQRRSCCAKWVGGLCLQALQSPLPLTRRAERFFSYLSSAVLSRLENRFKRIRIWFLNTRNIKLFSSSIVI